MAHPDSFSSKSTLEAGGEKYEIFRLDALQSKYDVARLPYSIKILLENLLRFEDGEAVTADDVENVAKWAAKDEPSKEIAYTPARVLMQDFTGVPAVVDLAPHAGGIEPHEDARPALAVADAVRDDLVHCVHEVVDALGIQAALLTEAADHAAQFAERRQVRAHACLAA